MHGPRLGKKIVVLVVEIKTGLIYWFCFYQNRRWEIGYDMYPLDFMRFTQSLQMKYTWMIPTDSLPE